jgi:hypothetical protein
LCVDNSSLCEESTGHSYQLDVEDEKDPRPLAWMEEMKLGFPNFWASHTLGLATYPYTPNKETWRRAQKGLLHGQGHTLGRGRIKHPAHL